MRNSASILASQLWFPVLSLIATPYIVHTMGIERYGVFSLLPVFGGYLSYLDLGFGWAIIKFVAEHEATTDEQALRRTVATGLLITTLGGCIGGLILIGLARQIAMHVLQLPPALITETTRGLAISGVTFAINLPAGTLNGVLKGIHRFDLTSALQVSFGTATILGTIIVLYAGFGLPSVVMVGAVVSAISLATHFYLLYRLRPALCVPPWLYPSEFRRMFGFSVFTTMNRVGVTSVLQMDKFFVAYLLPVAELSYYSIAFTVAQKLNLVASNAGTVLFPVASEQFATDGGQRYKRLYVRAAELVCLLTLVPATVLSLFAKDFLRAWLGPAFAAHGATPLIFLAVGFAATSIATIEAISIEGGGRPRVSAAFLGVSGVVNLVLCPILTRAYGISGTAAAVAISLIVLALLNIRFFSTRMMGASVAATIRASYLRPAAVTVLAFAGTYGVLQIRPSDLIPILATMATIVMVVCGAGAWGMLNRSEQQAVKVFIFSRVRTS